MNSGPGSTDKKGAEPPAVSAAPSLRRDLLAALVADSAFLLFLLLSDMVPALVYAGCAVFLVVGLWVGRGSGRPWLDGAIYGLLAALVAAALIALVTELGWLGWLVGFWLALPQGVLGVWLGARLLRRRE